MLKPLKIVCQYLLLPQCILTLILYFCNLNCKIWGASDKKVTKCKCKRLSKCHITIPPPPHPYVRPMCSGESRETERVEGTLHCQWGEDTGRENSLSDSIVTSQDLYRIGAATVKSHMGMKRSVLCCSCSDTFKIFFYVICCSDLICWSLSDN